jgi:lipopolysaccharide transport system ATP-binding protein
MNDIAIHAKHLGKCYHIYNNPHDRLKQFVIPRLQRLVGRQPRQYFHEFWALNDVSFEIKKGETVGIIGRNGSGKSTLLQLLCGTLTPSSGEVEINGRVAALLELGSGFNLEFTGRENVYMNAAVLGSSQEEIESRFDDIVAFAEIGEFIEQPVKTYSSGMMVRLAFAVAIHVEPEILIVDEALSVGDELFQRKCFSRIEAIRASGATILFVSHSGGQIVELCDRAILLDAGENIAIGIPKKIVGQYQKLLYATSDKRSYIRTQIRHANIWHDVQPIEQNAVLSQHIITEHNNDYKDSFDPSLKPTSTIEYESRGACIEAPKIITLDGRVVNKIVYGESYRFLYTVEFTRPAKNILFSMLIKTVNGIELSSGVLPKNNQDPLFVEDYCKVSVEFLFTCKLLPGVYYINVGCRGSIHKKEEIFLHRIVDAICFRVLPQENMGVRAGYFDFIEPVDYKFSMEK